jgi:hypothetical protein
MMTSFCNATAVSCHHLPPDSLTDHLQANELVAQQTQTARQQEGSGRHLSIACFAEGKVLDGRRRSGGDRGHGRRHHDVSQRRQQHAVSVYDGRRAASAD